MTHPLTRIKRDHPQIVEALDAQGWTMELTNRSHIRFCSPTGRFVFASGTPSDAYFASRKMTADLERAGLDLTPTRKEKAVKVESELKELGIEYWTLSQAATYLDATAKEVREWHRAGMLPVATNAPVRRGRPGLWFFSTTITSFKDSPEHQAIRSVRRKPKSPESIEIESLRIVVARRSMEELTPKELADVLADAMKPVIEEAVRDVLTALLRKATA